MLLQDTIYFKINFYVWYWPEGQFLYDWSITFNSSNDDFYKEIFSIIGSYPTYDDIIYKTNAIREYRKSEIINKI